MKNTKYFKNQEELEKYYGNTSNIPSNVLAIVGAESDEDKVLFTTSNNQSISGSMQEEGGYVTDWQEVEQLGYIIPAGSLSITENGEDIDVSSYASVDVDVQTGIQPEGTYNITINGQYDIASYANANVSVPASAVTSGTKEVTVNGDYDVTSYKTVTVLVEGQTEYESIDVIDNGHVNVASYAFAYVSVPASAVTSGTKSITENGVADVTSYKNVDVNVPIPAGYIMPTGTYNITENGMWDVKNYENASVSVPASIIEVIPPGYSYVSGSYSISDSGNYDVSSYEYAYVNVSPSVSGTYYVNDNGIYDISEYEYVDVSVSGSPVTTYTWTGLTRGGNPDVNQSGERSDSENNSMLIYVKEGSAWYNQKYYQIIPSRQFAYQLPTSITARTWDDYNPSTYIMTDYSGCTYSCDPSNYDNLTNVMNTDGGSSGQDCSYEVSELDVYGLSDYSMTTAGFFGSNVHKLSKLTDLICRQWNTDDPSNPYQTDMKSTMLCAALTDANHTAFIPETSYFGEMTDIRNLAGRTWKMIFTQYQTRLALKDIVGPVSGSEVYLNEIDDVWANWMGGWNGSTSSSYNSSTGNIEIQYTANYVIGSSTTPNVAELHQLEYRLTSGGTARRIDTEVVGSLATADHTNLSGTVTLNAIPRTNEMYHYVNLFNIDNSDLQNEGYTQYDLTLTLKIPHDMWLYGSANHNQMTLDWTLTPSSVQPSEEVNYLAAAIGTNQFATDTSGSQTQDGWELSTTKSSKSVNELNNYRIWSIKVGSSINGTTQWLPDILFTEVVYNTHNEATVTLIPDDGDAQVFGVDSTHVSGTGNGTFKVKVYDDFFDSTSQNYHKAVITLDLDGYTINT